MVYAAYVVDGVLEVGMLVIHAAEHDTSPGEHMYAGVEVSSRGLGGESDGRAGASRVTGDDCRDGVLEMSAGRLAGGGGLTSVESKSQNLGGYEPVFSESPDVEEPDSLSMLGSLLKPLGEGGSERPKCGVEMSS